MRRHIGNAIELVPAKKHMEIKLTSEGRVLWVSQ